MMDQNLIVLETERLFIKKIVPSDFRNFLRLHQDANVMKHFDGGAKTLEQARRRFNEAMEHQEKFGFSYYNVFLKDNNTYIGQTGFFYNFDMTINLCYAFLTQYQHKGYATEALSSLLKYGFETLKIPAVTLMSTPDNLASINLATKMGAVFTKKGILASGLNVYKYRIGRDDFFKALPLIKNYKYRKAVGAILVDKNNSIYLFQRNDFPDTWQSVEGGIDGEETEENAIYREIYEEIGIHKDKLKFIKKCKDYYKYNYINNEIKYGYIGQKKLFFLFEFLGNISDFSFKNENNPQEFIDVKLCNTKDVIKLTPDFKKDLYTNVLKEFSLIK